jgi:hypothetical protein
VFSQCTARNDRGLFEQDGKVAQSVQAILDNLSHQAAVKAEKQL